jgi:hypothetical protein
MTVAAALSPLQRLEIREACERLALDYAHFADNGQMDAWSRLFAEDGELHLFGQVHVGPAAIRAAVGDGRPPEAFSLHVTTNHRIDITGEDAAEGTAYIIAFTGERTPGAPASVAQIAPAAVGVYRDAYRRTPAGWRFARRAFEPIIVAG